MNREIKFRGLIKFEDGCDIQRWAYGDKCVVEGKVYIILDDAEIVDSRYSTEPCITGFVGHRRPIHRPQGQERQRDISRRQDKVPNGVRLF
jgi:hypothetical protein